MTEGAQSNVCSREVEPGLSRLPTLLRPDHLRSASKEELTALREACISFLARLERGTSATQGPQTDNRLLRNILDYTDRNIADSTLSPRGVAERFGISVRYLHKIFAGSGETFGSYVTTQRLEHVKNELMSGAAVQSIAALARKWGFRDISGFNRAFRKRFGCAPRRFRTRGA